MVLLPSNMMPLGSKAPDFKLPDTVTGENVALDDIKSDIATVILFLCNHCPYVIHIRDKIAEVAREYQEKGIQFVAISANDADEYPADGPDQMKQVAEEVGFTFPYLYDKTQAVARAYDAACTPDIFIFDKDLTCVYRGRFDAASPGNNKPVTGQDLSQALDCLLAGDPIPHDQTPSMGCSIKWK